MKVEKIADKNFIVKEEKITMRFSYEELDMQIEKHQKAIATLQALREEALRIDREQLS